MFQLWFIQLKARKDSLLIFRIATLKLQNEDTLVIMGDCNTPARINCLTLSLLPKDVSKCNGNGLTFLYLFTQHDLSVSSIYFNQKNKKGSRPKN